MPQQHPSDPNKVGTGLGKRLGRIEDEVRRQGVRAQGRDDVGDPIRAVDPDEETEPPTTEAMTFGVSGWMTGPSPE